MWRWPTFLQARDLHREPRWGDVFHRRHPILSCLLHLLVLHPKWLDGEAAVTTRNPSHICRRFRCRGDCGLVRGFGSCRGRRMVSERGREKIWTPRQHSVIMTVKAKHVTLSTYWELILQRQRGKGDGELLVKRRMVRSSGSCCRIASCHSYFGKSVCYS